MQQPRKRLRVIAREIPDVSDIYFEFGSMEGKILRREKNRKMPARHIRMADKSWEFVAGTFWWRVWSDSAVICGKVMLVK